MSNDVAIPKPKDGLGDSDITEVISQIGQSGYVNFLNSCLTLQDLQNKMIQSFRVHRRYETDQDTGRRKLVARGHKKGTFLAFPDPTDEDKLLIGYSLCHKNDRFDYHMGLKMEGLGAWYAFIKATKYANSKKFIVATDKKAKQLPKPIVKIPQSIAKDLAKFILRCRKFYKGKELPEWTINFTIEQLPKLGEMLEAPKDEKAI